MTLPDRVAGAVARAPLVFGTAPLATGFWGNDEATAVAAAVEGIDRGIAWFDTAPLYGAGESERRLGAALAARADADVVVSTKVGRPVVIGDGGAEAGFDYSASGTRRSLEDSLTRLGRDHVDIAHVHDPDDHLDVALDECFPTLADLRAEGVIGAVSVGTMVCATALRVLAEAEPDLVMIANRLTLLDRSALDELAPACAAAGVPLVAAAPFNSGLLARTVPGSWFDYAPADAALLGRAQAMSARCDEAGVSLRAAALQYPLRHDPVVAVVAGMASAAEVADNVGLFRAPIPADLWTALEAI